MNLKHLSMFSGVVNQLQGTGLTPFDDKLKAIFLLMTLSDSWETLVVSLLNSATLTYDGVRGSILNEEIRRQSSEDEGISTNVVRGGNEKRSSNASRRRSKSKNKGEGSTSKDKKDVTGKVT